MRCWCTLIHSLCVLGNKGVFGTSCVIGTKVLSVLGNKSVLGMSCVVDTKMLNVLGTNKCTIGT